MRQAHILTRRGEVSPHVLLVGDPARVDRIRPYLESVVDLAYNREFKSIRGSYKGLDVTVLSTGIGGPSMAIALEELVQCGASCLIRLGFCGAIQEGIGLGDLVIATAAVREDGASRMYLAENYPAVPDFLLTEAILGLARSQGLDYHLGLIRSHDSFYTDREEELRDYYREKNVLASDMETASLFVLGSLRGVRTASILNNVVLAEGDLAEGINKFLDQEEATGLGEKRQIRLGLEALVLMAK